MAAYAFAAAGTGGHVFPALAVADELVASGTPQSEIVFFGGTRMAASEVPSAGYDYVEVPLRGLQRSLTVRNLGIPFVVIRATRQIGAQLRSRNVRAMLATGGYVTVPAGWAASRAGVKLFLHEQNAKPGLANKVAARWSQKAFLSLPEAAGELPGDVVGTPLRGQFVEFDRTALRPEALAKYGLSGSVPVVGILGGSLGAKELNDAAPMLAKELDGLADLIQLTGRAHETAAAQMALESGLDWHVLGFEEEMHLFYAACDLVVCRGGATTVSELTATGTPAIVVPRRAVDQEANAAALAASGAAVALTETDRLGAVAAGLVASPAELASMAAKSRSQGRPGAATRIAAEMREAAQ